MTANRAIGMIGSDFFLTFLDFLIVAERTTGGIESCPTLKIWLGGSFVAPLEKALEFFGILFSKRVCPVARCITKAADQKFHPHDFSVLRSRALFTSAVEYLGEVLSIS